MLISLDLLGSDSFGSLRAVLVTDSVKRLTQDPPAFVITFILWAALISRHWKWGVWPSLHFILDESSSQSAGGELSWSWFYLLGFFGDVWSQQIVEELLLFIYRFTLDLAVCDAGNLYWAGHTRSPWAACRLNMCRSVMPSTLWLLPC